LGRWIGSKLTRSQHFFRQQVEVEVAATAEVVLEVGSADEFQQSVMIL
jgi:hypothetical protein